MQENVEILQKKARLLRRQVLGTIAKVGHGHIGGTFSCVDILVALYYGGILKFDSANPKWSERDRFLIGKGHASVALYHIWVDLGFLDISRLEQYEKKEYTKSGNSLNNQLDISIPGSEYNTGSLGHVIGVGAGMALAAKMDHKNYKIIVLVGDGECAEGSIWESVMFASRQRLNNLITIIDRNRLSLSDIVEVDDGSGRLDEKFKTCGWECAVIDGHSFKEILSAFSRLEKLEKPLVIIADTVKGKGVSFMENGIKWHHSVLTREEFELARKELETEV